MKVWKKNVVAAGVLVTVCAGIYLNWLYTEDVQTASLDDVLSQEKIMDESMLVMAGDTGELAANEDSALSDTATDYFAAVRLSRQEARDSAVNLLQEAMAYDSSSDGSSAQELEEIIQVALSEAQIESLVIAKGYADCVAFMSDGSLSVVVSTQSGELESADIAKITDIAMTESGLPASDIKIMAAD